MGTYHNALTVCVQLCYVGRGDLGGLLDEDIGEKLYEKVVRNHGRGRGQLCASLEQKNLSMKARISRGGAEGRNRLENGEDDVTRTWTWNQKMRTTIRTIHGTEKTRT